MSFDDKYGLITIPTTRAILGNMGHSKFYNLVRAGLLAPLVKAGGRASRMPAGEIDQIRRAYIANLSDEEIRALVVQQVAARKELGIQPAPAADNATPPVSPADNATPQVRAARRGRGRPRKVSPTIEIEA
jgi:hypothetical protein